MTQILANHFGVLADGSSIDRVLLKNGIGTRLELSSLGASVMSLWLADRHGEFSDVVLGYESLGDYALDSHYMGATVGRYANRIRGGRFSLSGETHQVDINAPADAPRHHLHGGHDGLNRQAFNATLDHDAECQPRASFFVTSPDGHSGFAGELSLRVSFTLTHDNAVVIDYRAHSTKDTVLNITQHAYFNLRGHDTGSIDSHQLCILADAYTPTDDDKIPTGEICDVAGTPFDFRKMRSIHAPEADSRAPPNGGFDHNLVLNHDGTSPHLAAILADAHSGRRMTLFTSEPGLQLYTANYLDAVAGKSGSTYHPWAGVCLETQHFPDSPNQPAFPSTILRADTPWQSRTIWRFDTFNPPNRS
ncbi:MAG: aldose epimerase family protein [Pseudomonadota bacterium]